VRIPGSQVPVIQRWLDTLKRPVNHPSLHAPDRQAPPQRWPLFQARIPAGFPSPADDDLDDAIDLNTHLVRHPAATFFLRVQGESMTGAGIQDGDLVIVDRAEEPRSGSVVVAALDGELTLKFLQRDTNTEQVWLESAHPDYPARAITAETDLVIWGVVTHVVYAF
jgi:DNA polymerase V